MPEKKSKLTAYAPFDFGGKHYNAGDPFEIPASLTRDADFDEFRGTAGRKGRTEAEGIALIEVLPPATPKGDPIIRRHILPLKEG